jgi:hypothetical protein
LPGSLHFPPWQLILANFTGAEMLRGLGSLDQRISTMRYLFEDYALDPERRELSRGADVVLVAPQVFDLLEYLISNRSQRAVLVARPRRLAAKRRSALCAVRAGVWVGAGPIVLI